MRFPTLLCVMLSTLFTTAPSAHAAPGTAAADNHERTVKLSFVETTDVHGNYLPYDFIGQKSGSGSLSRVATFVENLRDTLGRESVVLLDNGDILQGQPTAYYYNFIDTVTPHLASRIYDFMGYDAATMGNHDVETGHAVYDRWRKQTSTPVLGANVIDKTTGKPYLKPYLVVNRKGVKVAILGLLTPAIPAWLPENLWSGLRFDDMVDAARYWVDKIKREEKPDVMIGLFHSGRDSTRTTDSMMENASLYIARHVPGFDVVFYGHDHRKYYDEVTVPGSPSSTLVLNPANNAQNVAVADITLRQKSDGSFEIVRKSGRIEDVTALEPSEAFLNAFSADGNAVKDFVSRQIGECTDTMTTREAYFGPSTFMQLVHDLQLAISGADISFAAPLAFDATIAAGPLHVSDMFTLYKYENMLYTMRLTGREIKDYLEMAYSLWTNQLSYDGCQLLKFASTNPTPADNRLSNPSYNFDSAAGINYTVDVTRPQGSKITIHSMADGTPFSLDKSYTVAVNSYRGNGGGDLMTKGAGIDRKELNSRIISSTDKDLRYYLLKEVERRKVIMPHNDRNWRFVPEDRASAAAELSRALLFGENASRDQK